MSEESEQIELERLSDLDGLGIGLWARGWYDPEVFAEAVRNHPIGRPVAPSDSIYQQYWRCVPTVYNGDRMMMYTRARGPGRGAFQVTVWEVWL